MEESEQNPASSERDDTVAPASPESIASGPGESEDPSAPLLDGERDDDGASGLDASKPQGWGTEADEQFNLDSSL